MYHAGGKDMARRVRTEFILCKHSQKRLAEDWERLVVSYILVIV